MHFLRLMSARLSAFMKRAHLHSFQITQQEPGRPGTRYHRDLKTPGTVTFSFFSTDLVPKYRVFWQQ